MDVFDLKNRASIAADANRFCFLTAGRIRIAQSISDPARS
jgi:hypothetical protein